MGDPVRLRVLSYNVHTQRDDPRALARTVRDLAPDVVIVQEGPRRLRWRARCAQLAHGFGLVVAAGGLPSLGNLILVSLRVRVRRAWCLAYPLTPGRHLRGAAFAECEVGGASLLVVGSHLATHAAERPGQARRLRDELRKSTRPVVVGADLNDEPGGPAYQALTESLVDAAAAVGDERPTYPCREPRRRIDMLLVEPGIGVRRYDVVDTPVSRAASDHFPILADLDLPRDGRTAVTRPVDYGSRSDDR
ncbi:endonuclease/exonuclease/phosphatase family protein [Pilimelia columellifera]|uniref:Endonuclease/exonuclease/phosphatase family protein n=1 Tax=Pilimelia columellifera subsp. columellifera TaxID=706583 RepID=A0ABN3NE04_9ACTN